LVSQNFWGFLGSATTKRLKNTDTEPQLVYNVEPPRALSELIACQQLGAYKVLAPLLLIDLTFTAIFLRALWVPQSTKRLENTDLESCLVSTVKTPMHNQKFLLVNFLVLLIDNILGIEES
jgi:hypothetical protein